MAQDQDKNDLATINGKIVRLMSELENEDLVADGRRRLEKQLVTLIDMRIEIEKKANRTSS